MKENEYKIQYNKKYLNQFAEKKIAVVFCHCFFDAPHKYRTMIFEDFYEQIKFLSKIAKSRKDLIWIFKRHPNEISENDKIYLNEFQNSENIYYIKDELNNYDLLKFNIQFGITNHGTVGHEFAYLNIPIINTGDNPHINYNFNFHAKNRKEIVKTIDFILKNRKKINLKKSQIEEFAYMHYFYYKNLYGEVDFKLDKYLSTKDYNYNTTSKIFNNYIKNDYKFDSLAKRYVNNFFLKNKI
jgi:UDP-N-acetylglucosamine 2-epimerase